MTAPARGEVWRIAVPNRRGRPAMHPAVVIQVDDATSLHASVVVVPVTTSYAGPRHYAHVISERRNPFLTRKSTAVAPWMSHVAKEHFRNAAIGVLHPDDLTGIEIVVRRLLGI